MNYGPSKIVNNHQLSLIRGVSGKSLKQRIWYHVKKHNLIRLHQGIYMFSEYKDMLEIEDIYSLATSVYKPSYISFETVLESNGLTRQANQYIYVAAQYTKKMTFPNSKTHVQYLKLPIDLLLNTLGISVTKGYSIASLERALCDTLYRNPDYPIESIAGLDKNLLSQLAILYSAYKKKLRKRFIQLGII